MNKNSNGKEQGKSANAKKKTDINNVARTEIPLHIEEAITGLFKKYELDDVLLFSKVKKHWSFILTGSLCDKIKPARIEKGVLYVTADDPAYGNALMYQKQRILSYIRVTIQNKGVKNLVFIPAKK